MPTGNYPTEKLWIAFKMPKTTLSPVTTNIHVKKHLREQQMNTGDESLWILSSCVPQTKMKAKIAQIKLPKIERMAVIMSKTLRFLSSDVSAPWVPIV